MTSQKYRFRAELPSDVDDAMKGEWFTNLKVIEDETYHDCEVEFTSTLSIKEIRNIFDKVSDGHVMIESLNYAELYTGKRYYEYDD
jgi:hypothetical protein